ncbi:MAG: hypothetical protein NTY69_04980 [Methylococcales bacterium]|nr:hypothetical protein [Methylococcales bacterium]
MKIIKVLLTFILLSIPVKIAFYRNVLLKMTGNPSFTTPDINLTLVKIAVDELEAAELAAADGGKAATALMHDKEAIADSMYRILAAYVERVSLGVAALILSAGFDTTKEPTPREKAILTVIDGSNSGTVVLIAKMIEHAGSYIWMMQASAINGVEQEFIIIGNSTQAKFEMTGLIPGQIYYFCVAGVTSTGTTDFCAPISKRVV